MAQDDPLPTLLPKPPLPRPDRREAAIDQAMRRFNETDEAPATSYRESGIKRAWLAMPWGRSQFGATLATAIVALIVLPLWTSRERRPELAGPAATTVEKAPTVPSRGTGQPAAPLPPRLESTPAAVDRGDRLAAALPPQADEETVADRLAKAEAPAKPAASAPSAPEQASAIGSALRRSAHLAPPTIVLAEPEVSLAPLPTPQLAAVSPAAAASGRKRDDSSNDMIVTARRVESTSGLKASAPPSHPLARQTSRPGDWNACTVNDPTRSLETCTEPVSGHVAVGLSRAWQGDLDGAIDEFDQAIAASPQSGMAYLNRGLANERKGESQRALADLDRAVRQMPNSARAHYNRSLVLRRLGQKNRADADAARAMALDSRYRAVIR